GGYLATSGTGYIQASGVQPNAGIPVTTLDGGSQIFGAVANTGNFLVADGQQLDLIGTIINDGTIRLHATAHSAVVTIDAGDLTLNGGGHVVMITDQNDYFAN